MTKKPAGPENLKASQISLEAYKALKEKEAKRKFKWSAPWQVAVPIAIPFVFFILLLLMYFFYVRHIAVS
jgi:hypothetical protein